MPVTMTWVNSLCVGFHVTKICQIVPSIGLVYVWCPMFSLANEAASGMLLKRGTLGRDAIRMSTVKMLTVIMLTVNIFFGIT